MAIRFACPSCQQPIEIDDQWAGQSVGCPYCKRVVTAPPSSTWPPGDIPQATPAGEAFQPPPPPPGTSYPVQTSAPPTSNSAARALVLALICAACCVFAWLAWFVMLTQLAMEKVGPNPTQQEAAQALQEIIASGEAPTSPVITVAAFIGVICGLGGLLLAIRSLLRQETRKGMAIAACIISACFICCQLPIIMINLGANMSATTRPATSHAAPTEEQTSGHQGQIHDTQSE